jgi:hypothetical protein
LHFSDYIFYVWTTWWRSVWAKCVVIKNSNGKTYIVFCIMLYVVLLKIVCVSGRFIPWFHNTRWKMYVTKFKIQWTLFHMSSTCHHVRFISLLAFKYFVSDITYFCHSISSCRFLLPWWWRRYIPLKCRFLQEPHGITSQKTAFFLCLSICKPLGFHTAVLVKSSIREGSPKPWIGDFCSGDSNSYHSPMIFSALCDFHHQASDLSLHVNIHYIMLLCK